MRQIDTDILIAGGGPAGSAAAIACAQRGLRVILAERHPAGRDRPGEALHPGVEPLLAQLGVADRLGGVTGARFEGIRVRWGAARRYEPFGGSEGGTWRGFQVRRKDFDDLLLRRACELGVEVRQPCRVLDATASKGMETVLTDAGPVTCRTVIDASGGARWLSRKRGLAGAPFSPRLMVSFGYAKGSCPALDEAPSLDADALGWTWTARVRPGVYQWVRLNFDGASGSERGLPILLRELQKVDRVRGADVTWRLSSAAAGPGWFLVGDAAAMLDPASGRGVLKAIMSGIMAGHLANGVLNRDAPADAAAAAYRSWLEGWFTADATGLGELYRQLGAQGFGAELRGPDRALRKDN